MKRAPTILAALLAVSCAGTRDRAMNFGNTVAAAQMISAVSPGGQVLAYALTPLYFGGLAVYRAAGGKEYYPSGF